MNRRFFLAGCAYLVGASFFGCKPKAPYALVPVKGTINYNGKPLPEGFCVQFEPENGGRSSMAYPDASGSFEAVHTASQKGVMTGKNVIRLYWIKDPAVSPMPPEYSGIMAKYGGDSKEMVVDISKKDLNFKIEFKD